MLVPPQFLCRIQGFLRLLVFLGVSAVVGAPVPFGAKDDPATAEFVVGGDSSSELTFSQSLAIESKVGVFGTGLGFLGGESGGLLAM